MLVSYHNKSLSAPLQVDFGVTNRCNLSCQYCYALANERINKQEELSFEEIALLFQEFSEIGVLKVLISGGEPFIRDDINKILLLTKQFSFATYVSTNGTRITGETAKIIKKANIDLITVSLEGPNDEIHNKIRRSPFSFKNALRGIEFLKNEKISFAIGTTLNSINISHMFEMIDFVSGLGAKLFAIQVLCPTGRIADNLEILPNNEIFKDFFLKLTDIKKRTGFPIEVKLNVVNESPVFWEYYYPLFEGNKLNDLRDVWKIDLSMKCGNQISCVAGRTTCSIDANGDVYPCEMLLGKPSYIAGNIRRLKFRKIWKEAIVFEKFRKLTKDRLGSPCNSCSFKWCGGGCRAAAIFSTGSVSGADRHCRYANGK
ncbi:MAG: radical SAM protein [bacterium]|nr:radical SAM protein [bacterium]